MSENLSILVVEDNRLAAMNLSKLLESKGHKVTCAFSKDSAVGQISKDNDFGLCIFDLDLDVKLAGFDLLDLATKKNIPSVILSGHGEEDHIKKGFDLNCSDYLIKPYKPEMLDRIISKYTGSTKKCVDDFNKLIKEKFFTKHPQTLKQLEKISESLVSKQSIFVRGPSGSGKTILAKIIHDAVYPSRTNFVQVNCGALSQSLIESELFGSVKGSYTGSTGDKKGLLEQAHLGTLHLDEVACLSLSSQRRLLTFLDDGYITPVGGTNKNRIQVQCRIIYSTWEDLEGLVREGKFREDLYNKLSGLEVTIPALRDRGNDLELVIENKIKWLNSYRSYVVEDEAKKALLDYSWYGDFREVESFFESIKEKKIPILKRADLPGHIRSNINRFAKKTNEFAVTQGKLKLLEKMTSSEYLFLQENEFVKHFLDVYGYKPSKIRRKLGDMPQSRFEKHIKHINGEMS